jgi:hypothetical protein
MSALRGAAQSVDDVAYVVINVLQRRGQFICESRRPIVCCVNVIHLESHSAISTDIRGAP